ncbi:MAG: AsmA family protein [Rhodospirillales bacterium]|nr:AsmA family protein [Rhodospirillales bacterium]
MKRKSRIAFAFVVVAVGVITVGVAILKSLDFNAYRGTVAAEVEKAIGRELTIAGDLELGISFTPSLVVEGVSLANASWGSRPQMVTAKRLAAELELWPLLSGNVRLTSLELDGVDVLLEVDGQGRANWRFEKAASTREPGAGGGKPSDVPLVKEVVLRNSKLTYRDAKGTAAEVVVEELTLATEGLDDPILVDGRGGIGGAPMAIEGKVGSLNRLLDGTGSYPLAVKASAFGGEVSVEGAIALANPASGLDVAVIARIKDVAATLHDASASLPALASVQAPAAPFALTGRLLPSGRGQALEAIQATLGGSDLAGRITFEMAADGRPAVTAELTSRKIDLAGLKSAMSASPAPAASPSGAAGGAESGRLFPADPLPLDGLRAIDVKASLKADEIVLPGGAELTRTAFDLRLEKGGLRVEPLLTTVSGGSLKGAVSLDASGKAPALDIGLAGQGVQTATLLEKLGVSGFLQGGSTDFDIRLKGDGASVRDLMAGLDGEVTIRMGDGRIRRQALELAGADVAMQLLDALNPLAQRAEYTPLSCAVAHFQVKDGIAGAKNGIAIETDSVNIVGSGAVDLKTERLDFTVKPEAREGLGINLGASLSSLVRIHGRLAEPTIGVDREGAAKAAASVGAALATGGLSVLGQALLDRTSRDPHPCQTALGDVFPAEASGKSTGTLEGIGNAIENLFGGGRK